MTAQQSVSLTVAIPTFGREAVLVETIKAIAAIRPVDAEIIVVDQTASHTNETSRELRRWESDGTIRLCLMTPPSITSAMNLALRAASGRIVLFLDDDIIPEPGVIEAHLAAHTAGRAALIAGRVIQPWHSGIGENELEGFASPQSSYSCQFIGCNFSVDRELALRLGGFDENFVGAAYQYEAEFAHRVLQAGHKIYYEPAATIRHLKAPSGGTRKFKSHLTTIAPDHSVGAYYYIFRTTRGFASARDACRRVVMSVMTRHHVRRPWYIPVTLIAEMRGLALALQLAACGPKLIPSGNALPAGRNSA